MSDTFNYFNFNQWTKLKSLKKINRDQLIIEILYENGCTVNATKIISDDTSILLTYVVFPEGTTLTNDHLATLRTICETMIDK